nr:uncharacterized protein LOC127336661 [Lolium perenne]
MCVTAPHASVTTCRHARPPRTRASPTRPRCARTQLPTDRTQLPHQFLPLPKCTNKPPTLTRSNPAVAVAVLAAGAHVHPWPALRVTHVAARTHARGDAAARTHARLLPRAGGRQIRRHRQEHLQRAGGGRTTARLLWHLIFTTPASSPSSPTTSSTTRAAPPRSAPTTAGSTSSRRSCACSTTPTRTSACPCGTRSSHTLKAGVEVCGWISRGSVNLACRCPVLLPSHGCCRRQAPRASGCKIRTNAWPLSRSSPTQCQATPAQQPGA